MAIQRVLVTGGSGFIGSSFIRQKIEGLERIVNLDKLTYAADPSRLESVENHPSYRFIQGDICNTSLVRELCKEERIDTIVHFAAESHVDRSISDPLHFLESNLLGTVSLLEVVKALPSIYFHHVSTDEVYGSLTESGYFSEESAYLPNSPYAASKAASDHFVRAYAHTYGLKTTISHSSNNYGPYQHREKFLPCILASALEGKPIPIYGTGKNVRDWLYVEDHVEAIWLILTRGRQGEVYDIGAGEEMRNIDIVRLILKQLSLLTGKEYHSLITYVPDRPGHDYRYAIDSSKIKKELGWQTTCDLQEGLFKIIKWTLEQESVKI